MVQPLWRTELKFLKKLKTQHSAIAMTWKQPRCPSLDRWIKKMWYIYTKEYNSAKKKNELESVLMRRMKLEFVIQNEVSQKEKNKYHILTPICGTQKNDTDEPFHREGMETQT